MSTCPLTGRPCEHPKTFHISEITDIGVKQNMLCHVCAKPYFEDDMNNTPPDATSPAAMLRSMMEFMEQVKEDAPAPKMGKPALESLERFIDRNSEELSKLIAAQKYEEAAVLQKKLSKAAEVKANKDNLKQEMDEAVRAGKFDKAKEIKRQIEALLREFFT